MISRERKRVDEIFREYKKRYKIDFKQEFYIIELVKLKLQYQDTPYEHVKTKTDLMKLILELEQKLHLKEKIHTIPLIDEVTYSIYGDKRIVSDNDTLILKFDITNILKNKLEQGKKQNKLIDVTGFRAIGKTRQLIDFAKENNYSVIVPTVSQRKILREKYSYNHIYSQFENLRGIKFINCVIDEGVDYYELEKNNLNIITGYVNKNY